MPTAPPPWTPIDVRQFARIATCRLRWERRGLVEADDHTVAAHVSTNYRWAACPDGVPWAAVKAAWRLDEEAGLACILCAGALAVSAFGHGLTAGAITRECLRCRVSYRDGVGHSGVSEWLRRLPADVRPNRVSMGFSVRGGGAPKTPAASDDERGWARFVAGTWATRVPRGPGDYLVAAADGRAVTTRTVALDQGAVPRGERRSFTGWWWTIRLPSGSGEVQNPFGPA